MTVVEALVLTRLGNRTTTLTPYLRDWPARQPPLTFHTDLDDPRRVIGEDELCPQDIDFSQQPTLFPIASKLTSSGSSPAEPFEMSPR